MRGVDVERGSEYQLQQGKSRYSLFLTTHLIMCTVPTHAMSVLAACWTEGSHNPADCQVIEQWSTCMSAEVESADTN